MIDFKTYEEVKLEDVAEYGRAKQDHLYPAGTSTLQISATRGQIAYLDRAGYIETKHVAIIPIAGINPKYFNFVLQKNIDEFMHKYATGLNIQEQEVGNFPIQVHGPETQKAVVMMLKRIDDKSDEISGEIAALKRLKSNMLSNMMI